MTACVLLPGRIAYCLFLCCSWSSPYRLGRPGWDGFVSRALHAVPVLARAVYPRTLFASAAAGMRPGTAARPGTGRLTTGQAGGKL